MSSRNKTILLKVILLGEAHVGKTSIFQRFTMDVYTERYKPTIGAEYFSKDTKIRKRNVIFQVWDTPGLEKYRCLSKNFFRGADACMLVYDVCNRESFEALSFWVDYFVDGICAGAV